MNESDPSGWPWRGSEDGREIPTEPVAEDPASPDAGTPEGGGAGVAEVGESQVLAAEVPAGEPRTPESVAPAGTDAGAIPEAPGSAPDSDARDETDGPFAKQSETDLAVAVLPNPPKPRGRFVGTLTLVGIAILAFATGLFFFNNMIMPRLIHSVGEVRVPDLANLTVEQGEKELQPLGLQLSRSGERFDQSVPRGFILSQDPPPETPVRGKKRVQVVVSLGEEFSSVPELFGESMRSARYLIERAGLRIGGITRAYSEDVGEGLVVSSDPPPESVLPRDTPVSLLVSNGAGEESFVMPDLLGREISGARRRLEAHGFRVFTPPAAPSIGTIVFQEPPAGSRIRRGSTILLQATGRMIR